MSNRKTQRSPIMAAPYGQANFANQMHTLDALITPQDINAMWVNTMEQTGIRPVFYITWCLTPPDNYACSDFHEYNQTFIDSWFAGEVISQHIDQRKRVYTTYEN